MSMHKVKTAIKILEAARNRERGLHQRFNQDYIILLVKAGLLFSLRGREGGIFLAKDPSDITLLDIYQAMEGPLDRDDIIDIYLTCSLRRARLSDFLPEMEEVA